MSHWLGNLQQSTLQGTNNITIHYCAMVQTEPSPAMIMVNGRTESYLKYQSLINEFYQFGYSVYMLDHRGQGLSQRLLNNHHKGHVEDFSFYIEDLTQFVIVNYRYKRTMHKTLKEEVQEKEKLHEDPTPVVIKMTKKR